MPLQPSRGFCEIRFVSALARFGTLIICSCWRPPLAAATVTQHIASIRGTASVAAESEGRSPNFNDNLQSELKFNQETAKNDDRLPKNLYSVPKLDTYSKDQNPDIPEFDRATESESETTLAQLPNRRENRPEIPIPSRIPSSAPLPEPALPAPLPPPEQLLQPAAPAPTQPEELLNIPGPIEVD